LCSRYNNRIKRLKAAPHVHWAHPGGGQAGAGRRGHQGRGLLSCNLGGGEYSPGEENLSPWRKIILLIPMIFLLPHLWPDAVAGVYLEEPIAGTVAVCTAAPMFYAYYRRLKS